MTIFDYLRSILHTKDVITDTEEYNNFMTNRWISMSTPMNALILNESVNKNFVLQKDEHYNFLLNIIPQMRFKKVEYIKKQKEKLEKKEKDDIIPKIAEILEISQREVRESQEFIKYLCEIPENS